MEIWKDIKDYEGLYQISTFGRVRSLDRIVRNGRNKLPGVILKTRVNTSGYYSVDVSMDNKKKNFRVHRLMAMAFIENPDNLPEVNHKNSDKADNSLSNLEWVTKERNMEHFFTEGNFESRNKKLRNENNPNAKLTQKDVDLIKKLRSEYKIKRETLALLFGVSLSQIKRIIYGWQWNKEAI